MLAIQTIKKQAENRLALYYTNLVGRAGIDSENKTVQTNNLTNRGNFRCQFRAKPKRFLTVSTNFSLLKIIYKK
jgi:hypothetical protein